MKKIVILTSVIFSIILTGCGHTEKEVLDAEIAQKKDKVVREEKLKNPEVEVIGTFDGCEVKYYKRGYTTENFYISRCESGNTTTNTSFKSVRNGKYSHIEEDVNITNELDAIKKKRADLSKETEIKMNELKSAQNEVLIKSTAAKQELDIKISQLEVEKLKKEIKNKTEKAQKILEKLTPEERETLGFK